MRAQVVTDDVHGLLLGLACEEIFQKGDELCAGVAGASLANDLAPARMERRVQRERGVAGIIQTLSVGPARGGGEERGPTGPRLYGTLSAAPEDPPLGGGGLGKSHDVRR